MASQEEYLDNLLNELTNSDMFGNAADTVSKEVKEIAPEMEAEESVVEETAADKEDLMSLLAGSGDDELLEIQDLLQKSENNEMIDDAMLLSEDVSESEESLGSSAGEEKYMEQISIGDEMPEETSDELINTDFGAERQNKVEERKQKRAAQKEARKAAKEAKRAEKLAKKEAKKSERFTQKEVKKPETNPEENNLLEEDLLASIAALDLFADNADAENNPDVVADRADKEAVPDRTDKAEKAGEDSLAQIIDDVEKAQKKGLFARFKEFIMEEDEENEDVPISEENQKIIKEMDKEGKKKKVRKTKKAKKNETSVGEDAENAGAEGDKKDGKKKKEKKPKKEKTPKKEKVENPEEANSNKKKLPIKSILVISGVCLSIGVLIIVCTTVVGDYTVKQVGQKAYYEGDYETCYQNLYGKKLNESEQVMYSKSESILRIRLWIREYELLAEEGLEAEALDSLIQSVYDYPTLYSYASQWNAAGEVAESYNYILSILADKYHLTEAQAQEIANNPNDVEYTKMVLAIVDGRAFGAWNEPEESKKTDTAEEKVQEKLPDELPEESGLGDSTFVDNI